MKIFAAALTAFTVLIALPAPAATLRVLQPRFTATNAPDAITRAVLEKPLRRIASSSRDLASEVHANFPQLIEQNFARYDAVNSSRLLDHLTDRELKDLAYLYGTAVADSRRPARLLDVLAARLDAPRLVRVANHFGFAPVYDAVLRQAQAKATDFALKANVNSMPPASHTGAFGLYGSPLSAKAGTVNASPGPFMDYTPTEIYLSLRTAPVGSMGAAGALYETAMLLGQSAGVSFGFGFALGSMLAPVIEYYAPSLWDAIGGTLYEIFQPLRDAFPDTLGYANAQITVAGSFGMPEYMGSVFESTGGDYMVVEDWREFYGDGGGGRCPAMWCDLY